MTTTINADNVTGGAVVTGDSSGELGLQTAGTTRMTITSAGNVGIGTASPGAKLSVSGTSTWAHINGGNSNTAPIFASLNNETVSSATFGWLWYNNSTNGNLDLYRRNSSTTDTQVLSFDRSNGNVGIGITSPAQKLDVSGTSRYTFNVANSYTLQTSLNAAGSSFADDYKNALTHIWQTSGTERMRINSDGNLGVGTTGYSNVRLNVVGSNTTSANYAIYAENSSNTLLLAVRNDGAVYAPSWYSSTSASAANVYVDSYGVLYRSTSSLRYKTDIQDATHGLAEVLKLRSVTYNGKGKTDGDTVFGGLIAEEVHEAGLTEFVVYDKDGQPDALHYGNMVALLTKAIQEQQQQIDALKAEVAALKGE